MGQHASVQAYNNVNNRLPRNKGYSKPVTIDDAFDRYMRSPPGSEEAWVALAIYKEMHYAGVQPGKEMDDDD